MNIMVHAGTYRQTNKWVWREEGDAEVMLVLSGPDAGKFGISN